MKIISKYKDYYDYLMGVIGIDEKLILDRTEFSPISEYSITDDSMVTFYICGWRVEGLYRDGKFYYGEALEKFSHSKKFSWYDTKYNKLSEETHYSVRHKNTQGWGSNYMTFHKKPFKLIIKGEIGPNEGLNCPILMLSTHGNGVQYKGAHYLKFPILKDCNIASVFTAEQIWQMLYDFLSKTKDIPNTQTDKEKIIGHGFDYKESFRNTK